MIWKIVAIVILIGLITAGGFLYYQTNMQGNQPSGPSIAKEGTTPAPTEEPTPTEEPVDRSEYSIEIQNGVGTAGIAGTAKTFLEEEGYTITGTKNADNYDYTETVIYAGEDVPASWLRDLRDALSEKYTVQANVEDLDMETEADVVVVIGEPDTEDEATDVEATPTTEE